MIIKRKLVSYTDTKALALRKVKLLRRKGFTNLIIKKEYNGYSVFGVPKR